MADDKDFDTLIAALATGDQRTVRDAAHALGDLGDARAVEPLISLLRSTRDPIIWNAAAVGLRELRDARAVEPIIQLLRDSKSEGSRGTLVWALEVFDCAPHIELLVSLVISDNYEVARNAARAIVSIEGEIETAAWKRCIAALRAAIPKATEERVAVLEKLLARFEEE